MANYNFEKPPNAGPAVLFGAIGIGVVLLGMLLFNMVRTVPPGHVAVATLFGDIISKPYDAGMHFPVNPMYSWTEFDVRQKTHKEEAGVPSQDQLITQMDVSVQYRLIGAMAPEILGETGTVEDTINVHLIPTLRGMLRDEGKDIERAEDFFNKETVEKLKTSLTLRLQERLQPKGIAIEQVLVRDINLPPFITQAIEKKKQREQEAEQQKAELERFRTEQQQKIAQAEAERRAAEEEAEMRKVLADAQAYEIQKINEAVADSPAYVQLKALESLQNIAKDPSAKLYFINSDSPMPLPLMHMGDFDKLGK